MSDEDEKKSLLPAAIGGVLVGAGMVLTLSNRKVRKLAFTALEHLLGLKVVEEKPPEPEKKEGDK